MCTPSPYRTQSVGRGEMTEDVPGFASVMALGDSPSKRLVAGEFASSQGAKCVGGGGGGIVGYKRVRSAAVVAATDTPHGAEELPKVRRKGGGCEGPYFAQAPPGVARRNARERNRVKQVNNGFAALRQHLPVGAGGKKMSKVETLRTAVAYIRNLKELLDSEAMSVVDSRSSSVPNPIYYSGLQFPPQIGAANLLASQNSSGTYGSGQSSLLSPCSSDATSPSPSSCSETSPGYEKTLKYGSVESNLSPEDEDFLEAISWWQSHS